MKKEQEKTMNNEITRENVGERLKAAREKAGMGYLKTSRVTGLTVQTLFNIEHALHPKIYAQTIGKCAKFIKSAESGEYGKNSRS